MALNTNRQSSQRPAQPQFPAEGFARIPAVLATLGIGKAAFYQAVKEGRFPKGVKLGPRTTAWLVEEIRALIARLRGQSSDHGEAA